MSLNQYFSTINEQKCLRIKILVLKINENVFLREYYSTKKGTSYRFFVQIYLLTRLISNLFYDIFTWIPLKLFKK